MREGDIESHSGEAALTQVRELLRQARQQLDEFITSRSKPLLNTDRANRPRPADAQLATIFSGGGTLESHIRAIETAPPAFVESLIEQYYQRNTPMHLRPIWRKDWDASGPTPGQMTYTTLWGAPPRLYERNIWVWENMDRDREMKLHRETVCYFWRYDHGEHARGASTYTEMTVNADGAVELSSGPPYAFFPATPEGFAAQLEAFDKRSHS